MEWQAPPSGRIHHLDLDLDLAKHIFQVHAVDEMGKVAIRKRLRRSEVLPFFAGLRPCLIGMEACATSHPWARELISSATRSS